MWWTGRGELDTHRATDLFMARESWNGERWAASLRLAIAGVGALRLLVLEWQGLRGHDPAVQVPFVGLLVGIVVSAVSLYRWRPGRTDVGLALVASVTFDAVLMVWISSPRVWWPNDVYHGITHTTEFLAYPLVIVGAGFRLSKRLALYAGGLNAAIVAALVATDQYLNGPALLYTLTQSTLTFVLLGAATAAAYGIAARTTQLVEDGARYATMMGAYVSNEFMDLIMGGRSELYPDVVVLFSDLRDFTSYAQGIPPVQLVTELNEYLEAMASVINEHGGVVDKYMGDAIMVVYGVPKTTGDEAVRAIRTAWNMERALAEHNTRRTAESLPPLRHGIGVHLGPVIAGSIGTEKKLQYTVIGSTVNVASRLQGLSKELGTTIVLSERVVRAAEGQLESPPLVPKPIGTAQIRGWSGEQTVYTVNGADSP